MKENDGSVNSLPQPTEKTSLTPISEQEATVINSLLGISVEGIVDPNKLPESIHLDKFWLEASSILKEHPDDRELFIGWDLVEGKLQVTEVFVGLQPHEIPPELLDYNKKVGYRSFGWLPPHKPHLLVFHSHSRTSYEVSRKNNFKRIFCTTPPSSYSDLSDFVLRPDEYANIIVDISAKKDFRVGRVLVALKTTDSWDVNKENCQIKSLLLQMEMQVAELRRIHDTEIVGQPLFAGQGTKAMIEILGSDEHWSRFTDLTIYRGLIFESPEPKLLAYRWDVFYRKLKAMKRQKRWFISNLLPILLFQEN